MRSFIRNSQESFLMDQLITILKAIESSEAPDDALFTEAEDLANCLLIRDNGSRNYDNEIILRDLGFYVKCLEKDSFGWLVGGIETSHGFVQYG